MSLTIERSLSKIRCARVPRAHVSSLWSSFLKKALYFSLRHTAHLRLTAVQRGEVRLGPHLVVNPRRTLPQVSLSTHPVDSFVGPVKRSRQVDSLPSRRKREGYVKVVRRCRLALTHHIHGAIAQDVDKERVCESVAGGQCNLRQRTAMVSTQAPSPASLCTNML